MMQVFDGMTDEEFHYVKIARLRLGTTNIDDRVIKTYTTEMTVVSSRVFFTNREN
jgi:hypothetical protein